MKILLALALLASSAFAQTSKTEWVPVPVDRTAPGASTKTNCTAAIKKMYGQSLTCVERVITSDAPVSPPTTPTPTPPAGVAWTGVTATMWSEINAQRATFGDTNDCQARVALLPTSGGVTVAPGADINAALRANSLVFLQGGTYKLTSAISLDAGKKLIGVNGQTVIDASATQDAVDIRDNAVLANVFIRDAIDIGVNFYNPSTDAGSSGSLIYQVSVGRTGLPSTSNSNGVGFGVWYGAANNCLVSTEAFDTWNETGSTSTLANGGNADGYRNSYSAHHNSFIDSHSYRNGDDGFDMWEGGVAFFYFSDAHDSGKTTGKPTTGDGNGVKLGIGSVSHKLYKTTSNNNKANGFDINGNTVQPVLVQSTATGNGGQNYAGVTP